MFENVIFFSAALSVFLLGVSIGGIIEYRRSSKRFEERDAELVHNYVQIAGAISDIDGRLRLINKKCQYNTDGIQRIALAMEHYDPDRTQVFQTPKPTRRHRDTPSLPYRLGGLMPDD
jgi:uncharacterized membrane protein